MRRLLAASILSIALVGLGAPVTAQAAAPSASGPERCMNLGNSLNFFASYTLPENLASAKRKHKVTGVFKNNAERVLPTVATPTLKKLLTDILALSRKRQMKPEDFQEFYDEMRAIILAGNC